MSPAQSKDLFHKMRQLLEDDPFILVTCDHQGHDTMVVSNFRESRVMLKFIACAARRVAQEAAREEPPP